MRGSVAVNYYWLRQKSGCKLEPDTLGAVKIFKPELHLTNAVFTHYNKSFFTGPGNVQQVTDYENQNYKKPHWKHITSFKTLFSNTVPINKVLKKLIHRK
jgi:hypothetical protein